MDEQTIRYAYWKGRPVRHASGEVWVFEEGQWSPVRRGEWIMESSLMSADEYTLEFGQLPPLPKEAFKDHPRKSYPLTEDMGESFLEKATEGLKRLNAEREQGSAQKLSAAASAQKGPSLRSLRNGCLAAGAVVIGSMILVAVMVIKAKQSPHQWVRAEVLADVRACRTVLGPADEAEDRAGLNPTRTHCEVLKRGDRGSFFVGPTHTCFKLDRDGQQGCWDIAETSLTALRP